MIFLLDMLTVSWRKINNVEKSDDTKILIDTDDTLPDDITFKNFVMLMACVIKNEVDFYP